MIRLPGGGAPSVYDLYIAGRASVVLVVAVRLGVFAHVSEHAPTEAELGTALGLAPRGSAALVRSLRSLGLLTGRETLELTPEARSLLPAAHGSLAGLIDLDFDHFPTPEALLGAMKTGKHAVYGAEDVWDEHRDDPAAAMRFTDAMHAISETPASALAAVWRWGESVRLLDVGGGSGAFPLALLTRFPAMTAELLDLEPVCVAADRRFEDAGIADRAKALPGDLFAIDRPYPTADVVLFSQILHDWDPVQCRALLTRAAAALPCGGSVLIHEKLVDDGRPAPVANVLVDLDMLFWTEGRQYTAGELGAMLIDTGFEAVEVTPTTGYWSVVSATKR